MPSRLKPTNPIADSAILVGDPGRALMLAQELLVNPLMSNHARGLWGYSSATPEGRQLTIQATGMGGPSAAIVLADLARLGLRRAIRVGTCEALTAEHRPGAILRVEIAEAADGVSRSLSAGEADRPQRLAPDSELSNRLAEAGPAVTVRSGDLSGLLRQRLGETDRDGGDGEATDPERSETGAPRPGAAVADLQTGALFSVAARLGLGLAAILVVERAPFAAERSPGAAEVSPGEGQRSSWETASSETLEAQFKVAGRIAARALS